MANGRSAAVSVRMFMACDGLRFLIRLSVMESSLGFEVQGHRGACGLLPENTLPGFELALDLGVTSIETDVHLTRDGVPVLFHDARLSDRLCSRMDGGAVPDVLVSRLSRAELQSFRADRNPEPRHFPDQVAA